MIAALIVTLSACAAEPLLPADVQTSIEVEAPDNPIVGDSAKLTATTTLPEARTDVIETTLHARAPGGEWLPTDSPVILDAPGEWAFKTAVRIAAEDDDLTTSAVETIVVSDLTKLIQDLYYNERTAYQESTEAGWEYMVQNNYPGLWDASAAEAVALKKSDVTYGYWTNTVPDLTSLTPDPDWVINDTSACAIPQTEPVAGRTFLLTTTTTYGFNSDGYRSTPTPAQVHVTLLDGVVFYFHPLC